ncbi:hypothetical protein D3C72_1508860 [compost metagenome]
MHDFPAQRTQRRSDLARAQGDVANLHVRPEETHDGRADAQHQAQRHIAGDIRDVALPEAGPTGRAAFAKELARAPVIGHHVVHPVQREPVVGPARDQAGQPEQHAGRRRIDGRRAPDGKRIQRFARLVGADQRMPQRVRGHPLHRPRQGKHHGKIAQDRRRVRADHGQRVVQEGLAPLRRVGRVQPVSERRAGHGRLLGGQREVRKLDHQEAASVIQRGQ